MGSLERPFSCMGVCMELCWILGPLHTARMIVPERRLQSINMAPGLETPLGTG